MLRVALFTVTGVTLGVRSLQAFTDPAYMHPVAAADWFAVLSFSAGCSPSPSPSRCSRS